MVVTLKLHQIQYLSKVRHLFAAAVLARLVTRRVRWQGTLSLPPQTTDAPEEEEAPTLENAVVMTTGQLTKLANRISELEDEKKALRRRQKQIHKDNRRVAHVRATRVLVICLATGSAQPCACLQVIKASTAANGELRAKYEEVQMLKFGRMVDLDRLEKMADNRQADVLKAKVRQTEVKQMKELSDLDSVIKDTQVRTATASFKGVWPLQTNRVGVCSTSLPPPHAKTPFGCSGLRTSPTSSTRSRCRSMRPRASCPRPRTPPAPLGWTRRKSSGWCSLCGCRCAHPLAPRFASHTAGAECLALVCSPGARDQCAQGGDQPAQDEGWPRLHTEPCGAHAAGRVCTSVDRGWRRLVLKQRLLAHVSGNESHCECCHLISQSRRPIQTAAAPQSCALRARPTKG